jgi:2-amino-4-hydroxy-6-hydroxymethyldihydropteridine diphosphokinase
MPTLVYLGLGANLGDREQNLRRATDEIEKRIGNIVSRSAFYTTAPWGFRSEHPFLNAAVGVETELSPTDLLAACQAIERDMGRQRPSDTSEAYHDRIIDIDILLYGDSIINTPTLTIPHPLMTARAFVLDPLTEIAPNVVHPVYGKLLSSSV